MLVIGLTGGIGSGKSTVANLFAEMGVKIIDTDQLSRDLTEPDQAAFQAILAQFGAKVLLDNGKLDRKALRKMIFANAEKRLWLEQLLHPLIRRAMAQQVHAAKSPYCIVVIPLLFESKPNPLISRTLVVDTDEDMQIARVTHRDQHSIDEVKGIMGTQVTREQRLAAADDIIYNKGAIEKLVPQVEKLHQFYLSLC